MQHPEHFNENELSRLEQIALLTFHCKQDLKFAMRSYARVNKVATIAGVIVFIVMSSFLHSALFTGGADISAHLLAFVVNTTLAIIVCKLIIEFHPLRITGAKYWHSCDERKKQIKKLEQESVN